MKKLIELLNEYGKTSNCWPFETCRLEQATEWNSSYLVLSRDDNWEWDWKDWHLEVPRLISKEYGFIWWLVENDKIDDDKCDVINDIYNDELPSKYTRYDAILMWLAIQDNPIEFLISILK